MPEKVSVERCLRDGRMEISVSGTLDGDSSRVLLESSCELPRHIRLRLSGVRRITSSGLGVLLRLLGDLRASHVVELAECSSTLVDQFQMLEFSRYARIISFFATYLCNHCGEEVARLLEMSDLLVGSDGTVDAPTAKCVCGGTLLVDDPLEFAREHMPRGHHPR